MAKRQKKISTEKKVKNNLEQEASIVAPSVNKDRKLRKIVGVLLFFFGLFLLVSCFSYFSTWQYDQDKVFLIQNLYSYFTQNHVVVKNIAGKLGALFSHQIIFNGFGLASLLFIPFVFLWAFNLLLKKRIYPSLRAFFFTTICLLLLSPVLAYFLPSSQYVFPFGGALGNIIVKYLNNIAGTIGTFCIIVAIAICFLLLFFNPLVHSSFWKKLFAPKINSDIEESIHNTEITPKHDEKNNESIEIAHSIEDTVNTTENNEAVLMVDDSFFETTNDTLEENIFTSSEDVFAPAEIEKNTTTPIIAEELSIETESSNTKETDLTLQVTKVESEKNVIKDAHISVASQEPYDPSLELSNYKYPTIDLLEQRNIEEISIDKSELEQNKNQIINTLKSFGIHISKISATVGPTVTLYEIVPAEGVRISKIRNLEDDIALSLSALGIRIIAPIPGKGTIGIEVPNMKKQIVSMRTLIASDKFIHNDFSLPIAIGKKIDNENYIVDLSKMPHLLMAGATGQGKSVGINTILVSLLYKKHPSQLKFVMVDPKKVELSIYKTIEKHFLAKLPNEEDAIITDTKKVINTLNALCIEMDNRYDLLKNAGVRNIKEYNTKFIQRRLNPNKGHKYLPFIVLVVDEFADLIMTAGKEVEMPIARLAQLARAIGIHLIIATQRPSVNVITGTIKANFPARIAFKVSAKVDSRTILDAGGAEQLIGQGDMLILNGSEIVRLQCAFVDTHEVERIVDFIGDQQGYASAFELPEYNGADGGDLQVNNSKSVGTLDEMFAQCARLVISSGSGSTSMLQRRFNLGYNRAGRIMDQMEAMGIVGGSIGGKPRELLIHTEAELDELLKQIGV